MMKDAANSTNSKQNQPKSDFYNFFLADGYRITILILTVLGTLIVSLVIIKTLVIKKKQKNKFKLVFIVMINVMITAILEAVSYSINWVIKKRLLFDNEFSCQTQAFLLTFFQSSREIFVTLISIITFISFKLGDDFNIDDNKQSLIVTFLIGYLIPLIESLIYLLTKGYGISHSYCFTKVGEFYEIDDNKIKSSEICGAIHFSILISLILISTFFISYLIIDTACRNKNNNDFDLWLNEDNKKYCIHPMLKKIIFFPITQFFIMSVQFIYRFINYIERNDRRAVNLARPAAVVNSSSSIIYALIFAISNGIFTNLNKEVEEQNKINSGNSGFSFIELL